MSEHEKNLLMVMLGVLLLGALAVVIASIVLDTSVLISLSSIKVSTSAWIIFGLLGLAAAYSQQKIILEYTKMGGKDWPVERSRAVGASLGFVLSAILLGVIAYGFSREGLLKLSNSLIKASLGFSIVFGIMLMSAITTRLWYRCNNTQR